MMVGAACYLSRMSLVESLAESRALGALLDRLKGSHGGYDLVEHWTQREFHHDVVVRVCPEVPEFVGDLLPILEAARTHHGFNPCELLADDARRELRTEFR